MPEMLSVEGSPLSERAYLASRFQRSDPLSLREQARAVGLPGAFLGQTSLPDQRPAYRGKVTGAVRTLLSIFDRWQIDESDAALFLGYSAASFVKDLRVGTTGLTARDTKDRARLLVKIYEGVHSLMRDEDAERSWIRAPLGALGDRSIFDIMRGGSLFDLMYVSKYMDHVNGR